MAQEFVPADPGLFLEPNRFSIVKELDDRSLWLAMGYGKSIFLYRGVRIGLEGLVWSKLQTLSDFRFPVETADYFFGPFAVWGDKFVTWKFRISHISSHLVDGSDTVIGGSSSHYSREFVELTRSFYSGGRQPYTWTVGIRGYFHQVTKIEPWIAVPACFTWTFAKYEPNLGLLDVSPSYRPQAIGAPVITSYSFSAFVSSGDGPVWPTITGGLRADRFAEELGTLDLQLYYQYGASWSGTDAGAKRSTINLQMDVRGF
ncbi:MAG TPA: hypothetical protein VFX22_09990 [Candidatus Kapabacteria bacterium]|nr:hypothetical protein [Candidatus Kapabacteria bacterium]